MVIAVEALKAFLVPFINAITFLFLRMPNHRTAYGLKKEITFLFQRVKKN